MVIKSNSKLKSVMHKAVKSLRYVLPLSLVVTSACYADGGAAASASDLSGIASNVNAATKGLISIVADISVLAGIGFVVAGFMKFRQHSQNPQQVPMGQAIIPLLVGIMLGILPTIITISQKTVTGTSTGAKVGGSGLLSQFGGK
jgi:intracellular multiplication protein IcmD